jgi:hypothetical protein
MLNKTQLKKTFLPTIQNGQSRVGKVYALVIVSTGIEQLKADYMNRVPPANEDTVQLVEITLPVGARIVIVPDGTFPQQLFILP